MKILIWVACLFVAAIITTSLRMSGIILGAIPTVLLYAATYWVAKSLCAKYDEKNADKEKHE